MGEKDEGFVQRWSRLKQQARDEQQPEEARVSAVPSPTQAAPTDDKKEEAKEEKPFDLADLPPVESLTKDSDYSLFMRPEVPQELRQKALRQLWATDPVLSAPDVFDMHNLDYNAGLTFPEGVKTLYRVGRGLIDAIEAEAEQAAAQKTTPEKGGLDQANASAESSDAETAEKPADVAPQQDDSGKNGISGTNNS
jgi:hypothetical protein